MKIHFLLAFYIWLTAQFIYLGLNCICLFYEPAFFGISEAYAVGFGIPALFIFGIVFHLIAKWSKQPRVLLLSALFIAVTVTFLATLFAAYQFEPHRFWDAWLAWCIFPLTALFSASIAVMIYSRSIKKLVIEVPTKTVAYYTPE